MRARERRLRGDARLLGLVLLGLGLAGTARAGPPGLAGAAAAPVKPALAGLAVPTAEEVRGLVLLAQGLDPERFRRLATRAGQAAWLPVLEVRVDRNIEDDRSTSRSRSLSVSSAGVYLGPDDDTWVVATDDDWRIRVRAVWELDRLVFDPAELSALQRELALLEVRQRLIEQALKAHFERRQLVAQLLREPPIDAAARAGLAVKLERLTARLDALTDGGYSRRLRAAKGGSP